MRTYRNYQIWTLFKLEKRYYLPHWSDNGFKGTFANRALPSLHEEWKEGSRIEWKEGSRIEWKEGSRIELKEGSRIEWKEERKSEGEFKDKELGA